MSVTIHFAASRDDWENYAPHLRRALAEAGLDAALSPELGDPAAVDYIVYAPHEGLSDFTPFVRCKAVLSLWAGVERIAPNPTLTQPLVRMVDPGMTESMVEYVVGHVLRHHLGMDAHILGQDGVWRNRVRPPIARERNVAMLGLGVLGSSAARALAALNFPVMGWSRSARTIPGIDCRSGEDGLRAVLARAEIVVLLMPLTAETRDLLNAERLALLPKGAVIINPGRGPLVDDEALLAALEAGRIGHATLDVFRTEPLPPEHPFWAHPRVTVTPHIAADTRAVTATRVIAENIRRAEAGEPMANLVDRGRGY
ncbi:MAG: glyoxylate/hydroxypyruvate reductase A [Defluviimonas sp.]|uniref:2-hydroxyacid dehydrogenase n=1 Tax=Albidovulum sp. TaxID=1872424 RepID=UPI001D7EE7B8|nr:glyoxylate/hydroxypyruvate reductase A [Paracoccaceae bacterium]MCC0064640.1 glyoxylate/hydroxypyruvate reductase A [Defluviimonas sp.]